MLTESSRQADFPGLGRMTYLNTAAEGIPPRCVLDALGQYGRDKLLGMDGRKLHEKQWDGVREETAKLYGLRPEEIGLCSCSSEAFNLAALALRLVEGDEVIINDLDFPAGATPWLQESCPATARLWRSRDGALQVDDLVALLGPRTRLVSTSLVSFFNGYKVALPTVIDSIRRHSAALLAVDVTQAAGRVPLDLTGVDLIISSTHKWLLGSHGCGLVGVPRERADMLTVPAGGWFNLANAFDADRFERTVTKPGSASFSVGMPNYPAVYAIRAALDYINGVTPAAIDAHARPLVEACHAELRKVPVEMLTPDDPDAIAGILAFRHPKAEQLHHRLHDSGIHIMSHAGRLRVAIHGYNTALDIETFISTLKDGLTHV